MGSAQVARSTEGKRTRSSDRCKDDKHSCRHNERAKQPVESDKAFEQAEEIPGPGARRCAAARPQHSGRECGKPRVLGFGGLTAASPQPLQGSFRVAPARQKREDSPQVAPT